MRRAVIAMLSIGVLPILPAGAEAVNTNAGPMQISEVAKGFDEPWAIGFLPDGGILVTERAGSLWLIREGERTAVTGLPEVFAQGQGGLLDVMVPRDFATSREIWLSYARPARRGGATALGRGTLSEDGARIEGFKTVFAAEGYTGGRHFGSRIVEATDGTIYLTTGDRGTGPKGTQAQNAALAAGKVIHLDRDGSPATRIEGWMAGVHSLGHRNIQGAALDRDGTLLTVE
ncbi:MAG: PQQ-dependent sugar dehydrogenase, partial [Gemmobacter sp.]